MNKALHFPATLSTKNAAEQTMRWLTFSARGSYAQIVVFYKGGFLCHTPNKADPSPALPTLPFRVKMPSLFSI